MKKYNSNIKLGTATLNVVNFDRQLKFYTEAMGMTIISKKEIQERRRVCMQGIYFTLKITVDSIEELKRVFEEIRQIEKEYSCHCTQLEIEII